MEKETCQLCLEIVTNPICTKCYLRQINSWLKNMNITTMPRQIIIEKINHVTDYESFNTEKCIICNLNEITLCSYCFFSISKRIFDELSFPDQITGVFEAMFNYKEV